MRKSSAGLLMYRLLNGHVEVLLVHPGGPFWRKKDDGAWFVPKGEIEPGEDAIAAACREFAEETGVSAAGPFLELGTAKNKGGKVITVWAFEGDTDHTRIASNTFQMEWPPRSGKMSTFPEIDRADWFSIAKAVEKISSAEKPFITMLTKALQST